MAQLGNRSFDWTIRTPNLSDNLQSRVLKLSNCGVRIVEQTSRSTNLVRFATFEVDLRTGELRKAGVKLKFGGQPFQVLAILLERPGDIFTREELQKRLWSLDQQ